MSSIYNWEKTGDFSPYDWESSGDFSLYDWEKSGDFPPEPTDEHANVVRLENRRVVRDQVTGRDTDDGLMILPRQLGLDNEGQVEPLAPDLTLIDGGLEEQVMLENGSVKYPLLIVGGIGSLAAIQITKVLF